VRHEVLNAKQHTREAEIVAQAGRLGAVTVATNMAGRGVDILLGGYPEGLASRDVTGEGLDLETDEGKARYDELFAKHRAECKAEGDQVREAGGLYVLGTERHESRRIDNQLRGRSGRQGDPGESRFYLSLEDELMRLFATGAIQMVMGKNWPDEMPIESKMVSKAIERAQNTVEQRNAEIRKNVLKYDEVMNEQRKVIYRLRDQVLEGVDLSEQVSQYLAEAVDSALSDNCAADYVEEWDVDGLLTEVNTFWPTEISADQVKSAGATDELYDLLMTDATGHYGKREEELGSEAMREIERQVMLGIIDQKWREHLREMDYLQEGIHLRGIGQKDPLTEWQREGFEMFEELIKNSGLEFVKYIMHVQIVVEDAQPAVRNVQYSAPEDPSSAGSMAPAIGTQFESAGGGVAVEEAAEPEQQKPVVKSDFEKTGRNDPCPCGSGKKFKQCHGAA
jgi:preprotein translocase subunit SecA